MTFRDTNTDGFHIVEQPSVFSDCSPLASCAREYRAWAELSGAPSSSVILAVRSRLFIYLDDCPDVMEVDPSWLRVEATRLDPPAADASVSMDGGI
ncbi:MAG: hypothetical protein K8H88_21050 [Sandaracinaceae bacterium]|nr:hypothetical protein [Sandaracinaceae bacterium]